METQLTTQILATLLFQLFRQEVERKLEESPEEKRAYGVEHIFGFEEAVRTVQALAPERHDSTPPDGHELTPLEKLLLRFCSWGRDLGVLTQVKEEYWDHLPESVKKESSKDEVLRNSEEIAADFIQRKLPELLKQAVNEIKLVGGHKAHGPLNKYKDLVIQVEGKLEPHAGPFLNELIQDSGFSSRVQYDAERLAATVNLIAQHHRRSSSIADCPEQRRLSGEMIRTRLLAAILRLGNTLTIDHTRFEKPYDIFRVPVPREDDRILWIKSFILSAIRVDHTKENLHIQADLPVGASRSLGIRQDEGLVRLREMLDFVVSELEEDVLAVSKALHKGRFPLLLGVNCEVQEIPAMKYTDDIRAALDNIYAAFSPNTSQLITIALRSLKARLDEAKKNTADRAEILRKEVEQQLKDIQLQMEKRPCHEGLRKIGHLLKTVSQIWQSDAWAEVLRACRISLDEGNLRLSLIEGVHQVFVEQREQVRKKCEEPDFSASIFKGCKHIIVYGYSQQVIDLLGGVFRKNYSGKKPEEMPHIHVLECRTKTIYSSSGRLLYLDGQRYAKALREKLKEDPKITLEPDVALGKIILTFSGKKLVLLGSNAVYPDGEFVHSMGHTSVAAAAKALGGSEEEKGEEKEGEEGKKREVCNVVVVTDGMKIGKTPELKEEQERNRDAWLTHHRDIVNDLKDRGIELHNWREDRVPPELIDHLIILDKGANLKRQPPPAEDLFPDLSTMEFDAHGAYTSLLQKRILASILANAADRSNHREEMKAMDSDATEHEYNWFAAERFLAGKLITEGGKDPSSQRSQAARALESWVGGLWDAEKRKAIESLEQEILKHAGGA